MEEAQILKLFQGQDLHQSRMVDRPRSLELAGHVPLYMGVAGSPTANQFEHDHPAGLLMDGLVDLPQTPTTQPAPELVHLRPLLFGNP
jgi:hypothetical protein